MYKRTVTSKTGLCAIIGNPVEHSLSPVIHNAAFEHLDLDYVFLAFTVTRLKDAVDGIRALGLRGVSVTIPHKVAVLDYLDEIEDVARKIGAVNTIVNRGGRLVGYNTDWSGAIAALEEKVSLKGRRTLVLGAGGAARAVAFGLKERGAEITIANRTEKKAELLAAELGCGWEDLPAADVGTFDLVINTTSLGMHPHTESSPVGKELPGDAVVFDTVYTPLATRLIRDAEAKGCTTIRGIEMLVNQAVLQFALWTGAEAPRDLMKKTAVEMLS